tara:strand:- start:1694 stop:2125 length:432 start_codon:yes stop_codon:yes gene_type:complete
MTDSILLEVADGVTSLINLATLSQSFTAVRYYQPKFDLKEMDELHVSVVPRSITEKRLSRSLTAFDCAVDIGVQQRNDMSQLALDGLSNLVAEIAGLLRNNLLSGFSEARLIELSREPVFAPEHLDELRQFTSVVRAIYRVWR